MYAHSAMSYPHDDPFHQNNLSTVRAFLDEKHPSGYLVFNLSDHNYDASKLDNHVSHLYYAYIATQKWVLEVVNTVYVFLILVN